MFGINDSRVYPEMDKFVSIMEKRSKNHLGLSNKENAKKNLSMYFRTFYIELRGLLLEKKKDSKSKETEEKILKEINRYQRFLKLLELTKVNDGLKDFIEDRKKKLEELFERNSYVLGDCDERVK